MQNREALQHLGKFKTGSPNMAEPQRYQSLTQLRNLATRLSLLWLKNKLRIRLGIFNCLLRSELLANV